MFIPYKIETLIDRHPYANYAIIVLCVAFFINQITGSDFTKELILNKWSPSQLLGYMFLHGGLMHLIGNMIVLWVFGNAICANAGNLIFLGLYLSFGVIAGAAYLVAVPHPAVGCVGASGAICGIMGMAAVMYPINRVHCCWFWNIYTKAVSFAIPAWLLILVWFILDIYGIMKGVGHVAYASHIAGTLTGAGAAYIALEMKIIRLTPYDNRSVPEMIRGKSVEDREYE